MAYSADVVRRARARLAQAKTDRELENRQHLEQAYQQVPRLRQIDKLLRQTMIMAAQAAFDPNADVKEAMEKARQANVGLQQERAQLVKAYFKEGFLDEAPICQRCGGEGYIGSRMCDCLQALCREEQKKELTLLSGCPESFSQFRLDLYSDRYDPKYGASPRAIMERNFEICRRYGTAFSENSGNLLFVGGTGLGKTFLSACIARAAADRGYSVVYETASRLFGKLESARFNDDDDARRAVAQFSRCDLLIIDDLGTEMTSGFVVSALYSLLNDRLLPGKPTVISTNLNVDELAQRYSHQIASRLQGSFTRLTFVGDDIRVKKN